MSLTFLRIDRSNTADGYRSSGKIFSPVHISRLIPPKVGKEGIAKLSRLCNTGRLLSPPCSPGA